MRVEELARLLAVDEVVRRRRLVAEGATRHAILHAVRRDRLFVAGPGVLALTPSLDDRGRHRAAIESFAEEATAASHAASLWSWRIIEKLPELVDVTALRGNPSPRLGVRLHRSSAMPSQDLRRRDGLLLTSPPRALLERATLLDPDRLEQEVAVAERRGLALPGELRALLERIPSHPGAATLKAVLDREALMTRSQAEALLRDLLRQPAMRFTTNHHVHGWELDTAFPQARFAIEFDSQAFHEGWRAAERDREKDNDLLDHGWLVSRITWRPLIHEPYKLIARAASVVAQRPGTIASGSDLPIQASISRPTS